MKRIVLSIPLLFIILPLVLGQTQVKKNYKATLISTEPVINGILDDDVWEQGEPGRLARGTG